jgi:hypothetical protein
MNGLIAHRGAEKIGRQDLLSLATPASQSDTHTIIPHSNFVERIIQALAYRNINIVKDDYAIMKDGLRIFGTMTLDLQQNGVNLVLGLRNSHDKSFSIGIVAGFRVFVCDNLAFYGEYEALAHKHSKNLLNKIDDRITLAIDSTQRKFQPMMRQIDAWRGFTLSDTDAKGLIYRSFIQGELDAPERLASKVHAHYFDPPHEEFAPRTLWSLQNAYTEAFKELEPMPHTKALVSLNDFFRGLDVAPVQEHPDVITQAVEVA